MIQVIQLKDISKLTLKSQEKGKKTTSSKGNCVFEMAVGETVYMVGELAEDGSPTVESERAVCFEGAIKQALMPLIPDYGKGKKMGEQKSYAKYADIIVLNTRKKIFSIIYLSINKFFEQ